MSLDSLAKMNMRHEVFTEDALIRFAGARRGEEALKRIDGLMGELEARFTDIYCRLSDCESWQDYLEDLTQLMDLLKKKLESRKKPYIHWVAYRVLEEESKRAYIQEKVSGALPTISRLDQLW